MLSVNKNYDLLWKILYYNRLLCTLHIVIDTFKVIVFWVLDGWEYRPLCILIFSACICILAYPLSDLGRFILSYRIHIKDNNYFQGLVYYKEGISHSHVKIWNLRKKIRNVLIYFFKTFVFSVAYIHLTIVKTHIKNCLNIYIAFRNMSLPANELSRSKNQKIEIKNVE